MTSSSFVGRKIGYLGLNIMVQDDTDMTLLAVNTLKKDLESSDAHLQALALSAVGDIASQDMASELHSAVMQLWDHSNSLVRKKA